MTFRCDLRGRDPNIRQPVIRSMPTYLPRAEVSSDFVYSNDPRKLRELCYWRPKKTSKKRPKTGFVPDARARYSSSSEPNDGIKRTLGRKGGHAWGRLVCFKAICDLY